MEAGPAARPLGKELQNTCPAPAPRQAVPVPAQLLTAATNFQGTQEASGETPVRPLGQDGRSRPPHLGPGASP